MIKEHSAFLFQRNSILLYEGRVPSADEATLLPLSASGTLANLAPAGCIWGRVSSEQALPEKWEAADRREFGLRFGTEHFEVMGTAWGFADWYSQSRFCGCCGTKMKPAPGEHHGAKCPNCGHMLFPVICPAMIVAVEKDGKLLLAKNLMNKTGRFSVLAGFLEAGESIERAVVREVKEEVGIEVSDVEYVKSQYWPFPRSLMLACRAKWISGELTPDGTEIGEAHWYASDELPQNIPDTLTVAGQLIQDFVLRHAPKTSVNE